MKQKFLRLFLTMLVALVWRASYAYDAYIDGIYYNFSGSNAAVTSGSRYSGDIVVPTTVKYNGTTYSVTSIGERAFSNCSSLASIEIPSSVTSIGDGAFYGCSSLTSIEIPSSVTSIGYGAFLNCSSLTSIEIPSSVTSIIGNETFCGCSSLTSIAVAEGNTVYDSRDNCNAIIHTATNSLIFGCANTVIPSSITSIGKYAFGGCSSLTSIEIPSSVTSIGEDAFKGCLSLTSIAVAEGNTVYDSRDNCNAIIHTATNSLIFGFANTVIPSSVTSIGDCAFYDCSSLTSIEIPSSVTSIGVCAFYDCLSLTSIEIPSSVTSIGDGAFALCSSLEKITLASLPKGISNACIPETTKIYVPKAIYNDAVAKFPNNEVIAYKLFTITATSADEAMGSVTGAGEYAEDSEVTLTAVAAEGYEFVQWSDGSTENPYVFTASEDKTLTATFQKVVVEVPAEDTDIAQYDNVMYIEPQEVFVGRRVIVPVCLKNQANITGFSFELMLPEGMTVAKADNGKNMISLDGGRKDDSHSLSSNILEDGTVSVACLSMQNEVFSGSDGVVVNITVDVAEDMAEGEYPVVLRNIVMGTPSTQKHKVDVVKTTITVLDVLPGDVDGDGEITIVDAIGIVNFVIKANTEGLYEKAADADEDGEVTIVDAIWVVNQVIHLDSSNSNARKVSANSQEAALTMEDVTLSGEETFELPITLTGSASNITAAQFALTLPEGISIVSATTDADHIVAFQQQDASTQEYRFACLSLDSSTFSGNGETVVNLRLRKDSTFTDGTVSLTDGILATPSLAVIASPAATAHLTGALTDIAHLNAAAEGSSIYDLAGRKVRNANAGVSIVDGKKRAIMNR